MRFVIAQRAPERVRRGILARMRIAGRCPDPALWLHSRVGQQSGGIANPCHDRRRRRMARHARRASARIITAPPAISKARGRRIAGAVVAAWRAASADDIRRSCPTGKASDATRRCFNRTAAVPIDLSRFKKAGSRARPRTACNRANSDRDASGISRAAPRIGRLAVSITTRPKPASRRRTSGAPPARPAPRARTGPVRSRTAARSRREPPPSPPPRKRT